MYDITSYRTDEHERMDSIISSTRVEKSMILPLLQQYFLYQGMRTYMMFGCWMFDVLGV